MGGKVFGMALVFAGLLSSIPPSFAHHSLMAEYDMQKFVRIKGVVSKVYWGTPHTYFFLDVTSDTGKSEKWTIEGVAPKLLERMGWAMDTVKVGDSLAICGYGTRQNPILPPDIPSSVDAAKLIAAAQATLADGKSVWLFDANLNPMCAAR